MDRSKSLLFFIIIFSITILSGCDKTYSPQLSIDDHIVIEDVGFASPESVEYYPEEDVYLVTNINGDSFAKDSNGFISKIKPDGNIIDLKWLDGKKNNVNLNAPKGAAIVNKQLYVADIDQVHIFSLPSGVQQASITIPETTFLNGITPGQGNFVYVTDTGYSENPASPGTDGVYKVTSKGEYEVVIRDKNLGRPNGILAEKDQLMLVTFGPGPGKLKTLISGSQESIKSAPAGKLDGFLKLPDSRYLISSWQASAVYIWDPKQGFTLLANSLNTPADLGFDTKRRRVLVPLVKENKLVLLPLP